MFNKIVKIDQLLAKIWWSKTRESSSGIRRCTMDEWEWSGMKWRVAPLAGRSRIRSMLREGEKGADSWNSQASNLKLTCKVAPSHNRKSFEQTQTHTFALVAFRTFTAWWLARWAFFRYKEARSLEQFEFEHFLKSSFREK